MKKYNGYFFIFKLFQNALLYNKQQISSYKIKDFFGLVNNFRYQK
jgi:hypothetical protein